MYSAVYCTVSVKYLLRLRVFRYLCQQDTSPTCSLADMRELLKDDQVMYCLLRLTTTFDMSTTVKFVYIHWLVALLSHVPEFVQLSGLIRR